MNIYIIGKVDLEKIEETSKKFVSAQIELMRNGHEVTSLVKSQNLNWMKDKSDEVKVRMRMLTDAEAVFILPDWEEDAMTRLELATASELNKTLVTANGTVIPTRITIHLNAAEPTI